jgi:hypothetical protein
MTLSDCVLFVILTESDKGERLMKIIDDEQFFEYQAEWFKTQFQKGTDSGVWLDFKGVQNAYKMDRLDSFFEDVKHLRAMLNETGLKRLNNAISARRKRLKKTGYKSIQLNVQDSVAQKFNVMCHEMNLTQSEMFERLISGEVQMDMFK